MEAKAFFRHLLFLISVPKCPSCGTPLEEDDPALCKECRKSYEEIKEINCSLCARRLSRCNCTNRLLDRSYVHELIKVYRYRPQQPHLPSNDLIYSLKRHYRKDVISFLADELADAIRAGIPDLSQYAITSVPRRRASVVRYGYDHGEELAKAVAKRLSIVYKKLLLSKAKKAQKKLTTDERRENASCVPLRGAVAPSKYMILVDDIATSGSSLAAAATALHKTGAKKIVGAVLAIAYKEQNGVRNTKPIDM